MASPLELYQRSQRELRQLFKKFTTENCPTCPTPCCRKPARIAPADIMLAQAIGWRPPKGIDEGKSLSPADLAGRLVDTLGAEDFEATEGEPCEFLGEAGCTFPSDLQPFGCTAYVCKYMYARMNSHTMRRVRHLVCEMEDHHRVLLKSLRRLENES